MRSPTVFGSYQTIKPYDVARSLVQRSPSKLVGAGLALPGHPHCIARVSSAMWQGAPLLLPLLHTQLLFLSPYALASALTNVTVDDTLGSPDGAFKIVYSPDDSWSAGQDCTHCEATLDPSQVRNGTWHDTTYLSDNPPSSPLTATLTFDGKSPHFVSVLVH